LHIRLTLATFPYEPRRTGCRGDLATKTDDRTVTRKFLMASPWLQLSEGAIRRIVDMRLAGAA